MRTIDQFTKENHITADVARGVKEHPEHMQGMNPWTVILKYNNRLLSIPYFTGKAITATPTAEDALDCLAADASGYDCAEDFEGWASEYGFDTDSREAEQIYLQIQRQSKRLRHFLGNILYNELLNDVERL